MDHRESVSTFAEFELFKQCRGPAPGVAAKACRWSDVVWSFRARRTFSKGYIYFVPNFRFFFLIVLCRGGISSGGQEFFEGGSGSMGIRILTSLTPRSTTVMYRN